MHGTWLIVLLSMLYAALLDLALSEWMRHRRTRYLNCWAWLPIIVICSLVGPLAYLLLGNEWSRR